MELPILTHLSPVGLFSVQNFDFPISDHRSPFSGSDSSMDAVHEVLKLKHTSELDFFTWDGEIRIDEDKGSQNEQKINNTPGVQTKNSQQNSIFEKNIQFKQALPYNKEPILYNKGQSVLTKAQSAYDSSQNGDSKDLEGFVKDTGVQSFDKEKEQRMGEGTQDDFNKTSTDYQKSLKLLKGGGPRQLGDSARTEIDMYLEKSQMAASDTQVETSGSGAGSRKRKLEATWQGSKVARVAGSQDNHRNMIIATRIPQWSDVELDDPDYLSGSTYNITDPLLSLPGSKQETPSPTGPNREQSSPPWMNRQNVMMNNLLGMNGAGNNCSADQHSPNVGQMAGNCGPANQQQGMSQGSQQMAMHSGMSQQGTTRVMVPYANTQMQENSANEQNVMEVANGLLACSPQGSIEGYGSCSVKPIIAQADPLGSPDNRFQYVLAAATSIATKSNEDTLTYLNQCQSYEIKLKKLGDLSHYRGKILKSVITICFHERRLQFAAREQMSLWQSERPGERIVEVDVPLSYGLIHVSQPSDEPLLNTVEIFWDPVKETGVYIKVNCISTEFTAKKHGGEKGVPFRLQVETLLPGEGPPGSGVPLESPPIDRRLHAAACQIKVFKLKGADRKHKQDREKILRRPECERDKYQPSYECTVLTDLPFDAILSVIEEYAGPPFSPEQYESILPSRTAAPFQSSPPRINPPLQQLVLASPHNDMKLEQSLSRVNSHGSSLDGDEENTCKKIAQITPSSPGECFEPSLLNEMASAAETRSWLARNRFTPLTQTFANYSGSDLLRLSRDDLIQICSLADGIRLYNALHAEHAPARLTLYAKKGGEKPFSAIYLRTFQATELRRKLITLYQDGSPNAFKDSMNIYMAGPNGIKIHLTNEVIQNLKTDSMFCLEAVEGGIIMKIA